MQCPKCHHQQPDGLLECQNCSVIFSKLREREAEDPMYPSGEPAEPEYRSHVSPDDQPWEQPADDTPAWAKHPLLFFAMAGFFAWGAKHFHQSLTQMELEGGSMEIHWFFAFLYNTFGKWGVVLPFVALCGVMIVGGLKETMERFK